ncbi:MAG TPA: hypothetical protein VF053_03940 [Streptosporangiales bacterium]
MSESPTFAAAAAELPEKYADRLSDDDARWVHAAAAGGEYGEMLEALLAGLERSEAPVTVDERDELAHLAAEAGLPAGSTDGLSLRRSSGTSDQ